MSKKGSIIIFSSHRMEHVELFCKKIVILLKGKNVLSGNIKDIKKKYRKKNVFVKGNVTKEELETLAKESSRVQEFTEGKNIVKVIYVPGKLVNIVVK